MPYPLSTGQSIVSSDFVTVKSRIHNEAARRTINDPSPVTVSVGDVITAHIYNNYVDALTALNTKNTFVVPPKVSSGGTVHASETNALYVTLSNLENETLTCTFPLFSTSWSGSADGGYYVTSAAITFYKNADGTVTVTGAEQYYTYCGGTTAAWGTGYTNGASEISLVTPSTVSVSVVTNSQGLRAEQFTFAFQYRKGCCQGNDNNVQAYFWITARNDGTVEGSSHGYSQSQWGC